MADDVTYVGEDQEYAPIWRPEPGESIKGALESVHVMQGDYGPTPVLTLSGTDDGRQAVLVRGTVFREELAERRPKPGDVLTITYLGKKAPKSGRGMPYHVYKVLGGTEPEFNWDQFAPSRGSGGGSAEPPIDPEDLSPLPKGPTTEEKAASKFGDSVPF